MANMILACGSALIMESHSAQRWRKCKQRRLLVMRRNMFKHALEKTIKGVDGYRTGMERKFRIIPNPLLQAPLAGVSWAGPARVAGSSRFITRQRFIVG